jgi:hypothetical protein
MEEIQEQNKMIINLQKDKERLNAHQKSVEKQLDDNKEEQKKLLEKCFDLSQKN